MEKIFYVNANQSDVQVRSTLIEINDFIENEGTIISVTPNSVHSNTTGGWLVVANNKKVKGITI